MTYRGVFQRPANGRTLRMRRRQWNGNVAELPVALNSIVRHSFPTQTSRVPVGFRIASSMEHPIAVIDVEHDWRAN